MRVGCGWWYTYNRTVCSHSCLPGLWGKERPRRHSSPCCSQEWVGDGRQRSWSSSSPRCPVLRRNILCPDWYRLCLTLLLAPHLELFLKLLSSLKVLNNMNNVQLARLAMRTWELNETVIKGNFIVLVTFIGGAWKPKYFIQSNSCHIYIFIVFRLNQEISSRRRNGWQSCDRMK